ncbi:hypothetical protein SAMN05920897_10813 [Alkalispirochaeta americana]|uniref:Uncharacterized protein n=1 Tax=Alkalispirochaeta americana TaxID=159291 RepID=A0A1N6SC49_9SPIO|nr:hypothetical protein [Alkalispirochaeta americana]SIQ38597.1 hypothetical protein SAMN05920897_10813 [Alkalispirochaeta americana]
MNSLDRAREGTWRAARDRLRRPRDLLALYFQEPLQEEPRKALQETARELQNAAEGGMLEVKRRRFSQLYQELAEAQFSNSPLRHLPELASRGALLVVVVGLQGAILRDQSAWGEQTLPAHGHNPPRSEEAAGEPGAAEEMRLIVADVKDIMAKDPSARMDGAIKNILLQLQKYKKEAATFQKLKEQASEYRLEMYTRTFSASFQEIFSSIRRNYQEYQARKTGTPLMDTSKWSAVVVDQMEEAHRIHATALFLTKEQSNLREPLVTLARRAETAGALLDRDQEAARACAGGDQEAWRLNRAIAQEAARRLLDWTDSPHPEES